LLELALFELDQVFAVPREKRDVDFRMLASWRIAETSKRTGEDRHRCPSSGCSPKLGITPGIGRRTTANQRFRVLFHPSTLHIMAQGDKSAYTDKQKRQAEHIEESYEKRGVPEEEAEARAWATVNKQDGGGKKSGSGRKKSS
jgi:hypothetical protein